MLFGLDPDMEEIGKMASFQNLESFSEFFRQEFTQEESNFSFLWKLNPPKEPLEDENEVNWNIPYIPQ